MRLIMLCAAAGLAISCGKKDAATLTEPVSDEASARVETAAPDAASAASPAAAVEEDWPEGLPRPSVDYTGVYDFSLAEKGLEVTIASSGDDQRMAFPPGVGPGGGSWAQVVLNQDYGAKTYVWPVGEGAPKIATTMARSDLGGMASAFGVDVDAAANAKRTGTDEVAGEKCAIWEIAAAPDAEAPGSACVTRDGIMLRAKSGEQTVMEAKSITRGAQDPALFAPPADYEIIDMGECMRLSADMMEAIRAGKTPDASKMKKCAEMSEKMGQAFGRR